MIHSARRLFTGAALKTLAILGIASFGATTVFAQNLPQLEFPWKNNPASDAVYKMSDHPNGVFVFEALALFCSYCNENARNVDALATKYAAEPRVQVLDLSLDSSDSSIQQWIARHRPNHPVIKDVNRRAWNILKRDNGIPQAFVVDCAGELVDYVLGTWDEEAKTKIDTAIATALQRTCTQD